MKSPKILLGPAGNCAGSILESFKRLKELGLDCQEVEFTYGVKMQNSLAKEAGALANDLNIKLSIHAPYYVNLSSEDKKKIEASKSRIMTSCERGHYLGANVVVFHAGFYQKKTKEETYNIINEALVDLQKRIKEKGWKVKLAPETTGKKSQFGNIDELLQLRKDIRTELCVDFAHLKAREGKIDYDEIFAKIKKAKIPHLHCHYSGIEYGEKGEKRHLVMKDKDIKELLKAVIKHKQDCTIISESPVTWKDSLKMKMILDTLR